MKSCSSRLVIFVSDGVTLPAAATGGRQLRLIIHGSGTWSDAWYSKLDREVEPPDNELHLVGDHRRPPSIPCMRNSQLHILFCC